MIVATLLVKPGARAGQSCPSAGRREPSRLPSPQTSPELVTLGSAGDDVALVRALQQGARWAPAALYDRYAATVERLIVRLLGAGPDVDDVFQEVFAAAFRAIGDIRDPQRLRSWLLRIAVLTVREHLRSRRRRRWLVFGDEAQTAPDVESPARDDAQEAVACAYRLLDRIHESDRIPFVLHLLTTMELAEIAESCGVSLATVKRRISRARQWFLEEARKDMVLQPWLREEAQQP